MDSLAEDLQEIKTYLLTQDTLCESTIKAFLIRYDVPGHGSLIRTSSSLFHDSVLLEALLDNWDGLIEPVTFVKFIYAFCLIEDKSVTFTMFLESAGSTEVLRAMDTNVKSKELVYFGARSLVVLSHNQELRQSLSEGDGISLVVDCLHSHKRDNSTCMVLLVVLINLLYKNPESRRAFVASNGIPITLSVISSNHSHSSLLLAAFHVIRHATIDKNVRIAESKSKTHIFSDIISALQHHTQNEPLIVHALWIFLNLMNGNHENKTKFLTDHGVAALDAVVRDQERNDQIMTLIATIFQQMFKLQRLRTEILTKASKAILFNNLSIFMEPKPLIATYKALYTFALHSTARQQIGAAIAEKLLFHMRSPRLSSQFYAVIGKLFIRLCLDSGVKAHFSELHALEAVRTAKDHTLDYPAAVRFYLAAEVFLLSSDQTLPPRLDISEVLLMQHVGNSADNDSDSDKSDSSDEEDGDASIAAHAASDSSIRSSLDLTWEDSPRSHDSYSSNSSPGRHSIASDSEEGTPRGVSTDQEALPAPNSEPKDAGHHLDEVVGDVAPKMLMLSALKPSAPSIPTHHKIVGVSTVEVPASPRSDSKSSTSDSIPSITIEETESHESNAINSNASTFALDDPEMEALLKDIDEISSPAPSPRKPLLPGLSSISGSPSLASPGTKHRRQASRGSQASGGSIDDSLQDLDMELDLLRKESFGTSSLDKFDLDTSIDQEEGDLKNALEALNSSTTSAGHDPDEVLARIEAIAQQADQLSTSFSPDASELDKAILQLETDLSPSSTRSRPSLASLPPNPDTEDILSDHPNLHKTDSRELLESISALETGISFPLTPEDTSPQHEELPSPVVDHEPHLLLPNTTQEDTPSSPSSSSGLESVNTGDESDSDSDTADLSAQPEESGPISDNADPRSDPPCVDALQAEPASVDAELPVEEIIPDAHPELNGPTTASLGTLLEEDRNSEDLPNALPVPSISVPTHTTASPVENRHNPNQKPANGRMASAPAKEKEKPSFGLGNSLLVGAALAILLAIIVNYNL